MENRDKTDQELLDIIEHLEKELEKAKERNKRLTKRIKKMDTEKRALLEENEELDIEISTVEATKKVKLVAKEEHFGLICPVCGHPMIEISMANNKKFYKCENIECRYVIK